MSTLIGAILSFLFLHRVVSAGALRPVLVGLVGEQVFRLLFSLASAVCLVWLWLGYQHARSSVPLQAFYVPEPWLKMAQVPLQFIASMFVVAGLTTRSPTVAGLADSAREPHIVRGVVRITRHPFLWGVSLFSVGHMSVVPNLPGWTFFGTLLILALSGTVSIDAKRRRSLGADWAPFERATSNLPFRAIVDARQRIDLVEIGWWRLAIAVVIFTALQVTHDGLFGPS